MEEIEKRMHKQDELARKSAEEYDRKHKDDGNPIKRVKERNSFNELFTGYIVNPVAGFMEKIVHIFQKEKADETPLENTKLVGGSTTEEEKKIKGFNKKHVLIVGTIFTLIVVLGISIGTNSKKKAKKEDMDLNRGAVQGEHLHTMPRDYTELASLKKRELSQKERKKEEDKPKKELESQPKIQKHLPINKISNNFQEQQKQLEADRKLRDAAMASPIGFELKKR